MNINDCPLREGAFKFKENNLAVRSVAEKQGMICEKMPCTFSIFSDTMKCAICTWYALFGGGTTPMCHHVFDMSLEFKE